MLNTYTDIYIYIIAFNYKIPSRYRNVYIKRTYANIYIYNIHMYVLSQNIFTYILLYRFLLKKKKININQLLIYINEYVCVTECTYVCVFYNGIGLFAVFVIFNTIATMLYY